MKYYFLIVLLTIVSCDFFGQTPYFDAIKIKRYVENHEFITEISKINEVAAILSPYLNSPPLNARKGNQILALFQQTGSSNYNPFIASFINLSGVQANMFQDLTIQNSDNKLIRGVSNLDITNIADGVTKFIVARAKQELSITFFERFKKDIDSIAQLQTRFSISICIDIPILNIANSSVN